jgi:hypothetical protein
MKKKITIGFVFSILLAGGCTNNNSTNLTANIQSEKPTKKVVVSQETINNLIQSIPSPLELAAIIRGSGAEFSNAYLSSPDSAKNYMIDFQQAFGIGVYSSDLGYLNIYGKNFKTLQYLTAISDLSKKLNIDQFFDFPTLKRLSSNSSDFDSMMTISTAAFNKMDQYLKEKDRGELSIGIICGSWLEAMHLACEIATDKPTEELMDQIGAQKTTLENVLALLKAYEGIPLFDKMRTDFETIKDSYADITVTYQHVEPETKEVNGELVIVDKSKTIVNMDKQKLAAISAAIQTVRSKNI